MLFKIFIENRMVFNFVNVFQYPFKIENLVFHELKQTKVCILPPLNESLNQEDQSKFSEVEENQPMSLKTTPSF